MWTHWCCDNYLDFSFESQIPSESGIIKHTAQSGYAVCVCLTLNSQEVPLLRFDWQVFSLPHGLQIGKTHTRSEEKKVKAIHQCKCDNVPIISRLMESFIAASDNRSGPRQAVTSAAQSGRQCCLLTCSTVGHPAVSQSIINRLERGVRTAALRQSVAVLTTLTALWKWKYMNASLWASSSNYYYIVWVILF